MAHFVLEIGTEEMPARFVPALEKELVQKFSSRLQELNLAHGEIRTWGTPRRLAASITGLSSSQETEEKVFTGPPANIAMDEEGRPTKAGQGFARGHGVEFDQVFIEETAKGNYLAVRKTVGGKKTLDLLPDICTDVLSSLSFPKKMKWEPSGFTFGRPIRWVLALLDDQPVDFSIADVTAGRKTMGHRVMGPGPWHIDHADEYLPVLRKKGSVIIDPEERKGIIRTDGDKLALEHEGSIIWSESLLEQVASLVEYPVPVLADFDPVYLELPQEVLLTSMESHQKSFGVRSSDGRLLPKFLTVINLEPRDRDMVRRGWERVLKARLEDARFFWEADSSVELETWLNELDNVVFLGPLGSMGDKALRLERLCRILSEQTHPELQEDLSRAGRLAKADLVSEMVGEFADLQGIMGGIYARNKGLSETASRAIYEHYLPTGHESPVPETPGGAILAIADKADTLAGCFGLDMIPTGANDPYALRRQALGICRIILEHELQFDVRTVMEEAIAGFGGVEWKHTPAEALERLLDFFGNRLKAYFQSEGFETRQVEAALNAGFADVLNFKLRLSALSRFSRSETFEQAVLTFKRASNIIRKQGDEAGQPLTGHIEQPLLQEKAEQVLAEKLAEVEPRFEELWQEQDFDSLFTLLDELRPFVDDFFDQVMVICEDMKLRINRLNILQRLVKLLGRLADFSALQV